MEKKKTGVISRSLLIIGIALIVTAFIVSFVFLTNNKVDTEKFNHDLESNNFDRAYQRFIKSESDYLPTLDFYLSSIIEDYNNSLFAYEESVNKINNLVSVGFSENITYTYSEQLDSLNTSKETFSKANSLFSEYALDDAKSLYAKVISNDSNYSDAQYQIAKIDELITQNKNNYVNADELYLDNQLDKAAEAYQEIIDSNINVESAQIKIAHINDINAAWDEEFAGSDYTKCTYPYEAPAEDGFMYLPYTHKGNHTIIKYNIENGQSEIFLIARIPGMFIIKDINIVGDYIYFIAGENVGSGRMLTNPYNIYRMKTDGSNMELLIKGDYYNLIAYKDGFFVSSYSNGIQRLDRNFNIIEQLYDEPAIQMQLFEDKLHFTVDNHSPNIQIYSQYSYDGKELTLVRTQRNLRFAIYSDIEIFSQRKGDSYEERLIEYNQDTMEQKMILQADFAGILGLLNNNIVCLTEKRSGKIDYHLISMDDYVMSQFISRIPKGIQQFKNICYANETLIFSSESGFIITDSAYNYHAEIDLSSVDFNGLNTNNNFNFLHEDSEYYTDEEIIIAEEDFWYYSNFEYNIRIEKRYNEDFDANTFVAHIRTTNPEFMQVKSAYENTYFTKGNRKYPINLSRQYDAVFACSSDFFDLNAWTGISIRDGIVYKDRLLEDMAVLYPDGNLICYTKDDDITLDDLIAAEVKTTFSFGPILLSDYEYGQKIYNHHLVIQNPRNAIGMVEPGHYVVILCDGRQPNSAGLTFRSLAELFVAEGCCEAYNLDGGLSASMMFMGEYINSHTLDKTGGYFRTLPEIIFFGTSDLVPEEIPLK